MVKSYLKYEFYGAAAVIASHGSNLVCWPPVTAPPVPHAEQRILAPALETVGAWSVATGTLEGGYRPEQDVRRAEVTALASHPAGILLAVGHHNGGVSVCEMPEFAVVFTALHHLKQRAVTCLAWSASGALLASGAQDTDIVVWDVTSHEPLHHLRGHTGPIVGLKFLTESLLLSAGGKQDCTLRVWDLRLGEVVQQALTAVKELSAIGVDAACRRCVCGGVGKDLHVYSLEGVPESPPLEHGILERRAGRQSLVLSIRFNDPRGLLAVHGADKAVEVWRVLTEDEVDAKLAHLARRAQEKEKKRRKAEAEAAAQGAGAATEETAEAEEVTVWGPPVDTKEEDTGMQRTARAEYTHAHQFLADHKVRSVDWLPDALVLTTNRNSIERWSVSGSDAKPPARQAVIQTVGHRNLVRAACQSPDDLLLATLSEDIVLVWRIESASLVCSFPEATDGLCLRFLQGNKHLVVGTKGGTLDIYSVTTTARVESIRAHGDAVLSFFLSPDAKGLLSGGRDRKVVFWNYALATDAETQTKHISLVEGNSVEMDDAVLDVTYSPDGTKLALALQDNTVKVFYADTFKFALSLYGHKLPVNSISISSDSQLLVSGSMDKNLKIWGMTFGECRKSIFAHDDSITSVAFCPGTHYFFSVSKDTTIKYWDADHFTLVQIIRSHIEGITCLALNSDASMIVTSGHDRSVRAFFRSEELIFADEQRELDIEEAQDEETAERVDQTEGGKAAGHHSVATLKAGEMLSETITFVLRVQAHLEENKDTGVKKDDPTLALLFGKSPEQYLVAKVEGIRAADLAHAIALLPFTQCKSLLILLHSILTAPADRIPPPPAISTELAAKVVLLITQLHTTYLVQHPELVPVLRELRDTLQARLQRQADQIGFTTACLGFLQRKVEDDTDKTFFDLTKRRFHKKAKNYRRKTEPA